MCMQLTGCVSAGSLVCTPCAAGTFSAAPTASCATCAAGGYAPKGQISLWECNLKGYARKGSILHNQQLWYCYPQYSLLNSDIRQALRSAPPAPPSHFRLSRRHRAQSVLLAATRRKVRSRHCPRVAQPIYHQYVRLLMAASVGRLICLHSLCRRHLLHCADGKVRYVRCWQVCSGNRKYFVRSGLCSFLGLCFWRVVLRPSLRAFRFAS